MNNAQIIPLIAEYQRGNMTHFETVYDAFKNLILYYSRKLSYDDAIQDLNLFLVELLYKFELNLFPLDESMGVNKYIAVCLRNQYIALSKQAQAQNSLYTEYCECIAGSEACYEDDVSFSIALEVLTQKQKQVILYKYRYRYSDIEISEELEITRQAVNRILRRGLIILKEFYTDALYG